MYGRDVEQDANLRKVFHLSIRPDQAGKILILSFRGVHDEKVAAARGDVFNEILIQVKLSEFKFISNEFNLKEVTSSFFKVGNLNRILT